MSEEDDWFERALTEEEREDGAEGPEADEEREETPATGDEREGAPEADEEGDADELDGETEGEGAADGEADGDHLFEEEFADAFGDDAGAEEGAFGGDGGAFGGSGPFDGGGSSGGSPFGGAGAFGGGDDAFGGDADAFGMGELGDDEAADFSDEALESEIDRLDLGIEGLDDMIRGGVPESSLMTIIGSAGTGKTTFGLQFLEEGLANGEKTIFISLEESRERVIRSAEEKGWDFEEYAEEGRLAIVDIDPIQMATSLSSIRSELPRLIDEFGATRLVLDSVSLLEMMYDDRATRRNEIYTFARSLKGAGVTVLLTSEASVDNPYASRHGIVEYLTDAVFILQYVRPSDFRETRLAVEIQKIRDAHHSREMKPYEITDSGISVYRQANIF